MHGGIFSRDCPVLFFLFCGARDKAQSISATEIQRYSPVLAVAHFVFLFWYGISFRYSMLVLNWQSSCLNLQSSCKAVLSVYILSFSEIRVSQILNTSGTQLLPKCSHPTAMSFCWDIFCDFITVSKYIVCFKYSCSKYTYPIPYYAQVIGPCIFLIQSSSLNMTCKAFESCSTNMFWPIWWANYMKTFGNWYI